MNRKLPRLILILLIVALAVALLACSPTGEEPAGDGSSTNDAVGEQNPSGSTETLNKAQIFGEIKEGLINTGKLVDETTRGVRYVNSDYVLVTNAINVGIEYQANYDLDREQDSEIMVRIFDYVNERNTMFIYYVSNDLYIQTGEEYIKMEGFGGTSTFKLFYEAITNFDMEQMLFSVDFADNIETMASSVETQSISKIILSDDEYNISVKNINLDPLKTTVNDFITKNVGAFGTAFDALTKKFLGFELSKLGEIRIGRFNAELITVFEKQANGAQHVSDFNMIFAGNQANNIDTYYLGVNYATSYEKGAIRLTQFDNPENNNYLSKSVSSMHFTGDLYVPYFGERFDTDIQGNFSTEDNAINEVFIDIVNRTDNQGDFGYAFEERVFGAMYKDGVIYLDAKGLFEDYLGDFMTYDKIGLPRVKVEGFNMSNELQVLLEKVVGLLKFDFDLSGIFGSSDDTDADDGDNSLSNNDVFKLYLSKVRSENGVFYITIDKELINQVIGESDATLISLIANSLGLEEGLIRDIIELGYFDDLVLELAWDTNTNDLIITAKIKHVEKSKDTEKITYTDIFVLTLRSVGVGDESLDIAFPDRESGNANYFDTFEEFVNPETINVHLEGTIRTQGSEQNDISKLMGLFIGDISGKNTEYAIKVSDTLYLNMDLWQKGEDYFVNAKISLNGTPFVDICSNLLNPDELLINNYELGVKYVLPRATIIRQIGELTQNKAVWNFDSIVNALEILASDAKVDINEHLDANRDGVCDKCNKALNHVDTDKNGLCDDCGSKYVVSPDFISLVISPLYNEKTGAKIKDPLYDILGVENFIAELKVNIDFDAPTDLVNPNEYYEPIANLIDEQRWATRYEAKWRESVVISFGGVEKEFKLTFDPDSVDFAEGVYEYYPEAELFGKVIRYRMFITDTVYGTKKVKELYDSENTVYLMQIDPSKENPIPEKIAVRYEDGSVGYLPYEFVGFPYNNGNIATLMGGLKKAQYSVILGKGSITEQEFPMEIIVLGRNFVVGEDDYYNNIPIVARVTIDPFQYSLEKSEADARGEKYYPFKYRNQVETLEINGGLKEVDRETLLIKFHEYTGSLVIKTVELPKFDWGFNENMISYSGGEFTITAKYNNLDMAIVVIVQAKKVKHVQINSENPGYYTIDSLVTATYSIPAITEYDEEGNIVNEVRIYFETGRYRIIGNEPEDYENTDPLCDGYYNKPLDWSIKVADNVTIDRSIHPLNNGKTKYTECKFGDDGVGWQNVTLEVLCPTRRIDTRANTTLAVTSIQYMADGTINPEAIQREAVKVSLASFDKDESVDSDYFDFDPYSETSVEKTLPNIVYVSVTYQGRVQTIGYPVTWIEENNIINAQGEIMNAFAEETYMRVRGVIGDGECTQTLEMVIHNHSVSYRNILFYNVEYETDSEGNLVATTEKEIATVVKRYNKEDVEIKEGVEDLVEVSRRYFIEGLLNPFVEFELPNKVILQFPVESGMSDRTFEVSWYLKDANGDPIKDGGGNLVNAQGYFVGSKGGEVRVYADVKSDTDTAGALEQTIELTLVYDSSKVINERRIYGLASIDTYEMVEFETLHYMIIDGYDEQPIYDETNKEIIGYYSISQKLYDDLTVDGGIKMVDIGFADGTRTYDNTIAIDWINLDEFLQVLQSPLGSSSYYNMGKYKDDIIYLSGIIDDGSVDENGNPKGLVISMGFMVTPRVLGDINFGNFDKNLSAKDENNVSAVNVVTELERVTGETEIVDGEVVPVLNDKGYQILKISGKNSIDVTFNKYYALSDAKNNLLSPSEYVKYMFSNVSLMFADKIEVNDFEFTLPDYFDDVIYGNKTTTDTNFTITTTHVVYRFKIEKLTIGSCVQSFDVSLTFLKDRTVIGEEEAFNEEVEVFDSEGKPLYANNDGYVLNKEFVVEYVNSGAVKYTNLVWYADESVSSLVSNATISQGAVVESINYEFFNFTSTRIIKLYTTLPNGREYRRHISFYSKNVNFTKYHTENEGLYQVNNGTIAIDNVYDYLPLDDLLNNLPTVIVPDQTSAFISSYDIKFTLRGEWVPAKEFAKDDDSLAFDINKIKDAITSAGLSSTLFATNTIEGYNGETQEIKLYVSVRALYAGQISHEKYDIVSNNLLFDQYAIEGDGTFVLPKDIKVTFGDVEYQFEEEDGLIYEIRNNNNKSEFTRIDEITYNNMGHTLSGDFGYGANESLYLRITLPDGNNSLRLILTFPYRVLDKVYYASKTTDNSSVLVEGIYYIDPYDRLTFNLPTSAEFKYSGATNTISQNVKWTMETANAPFTMDANGNYVYNGGDYQGAYYLFSSSLRSFDENDNEQFFIMQVYVLDRTLTRPASYPATFQIENQLKPGSTDNYWTPFEMRVKDLPSTLSVEDFFDLSVERKITNTESEALSNLKTKLSTVGSTVTFNSDVQDKGNGEGVNVYYSEYVSALSPAIPNVLWRMEKEGQMVDLVDDDISVNGGFNYTIHGYLGVGEGEARTFGQVIDMKLRANTWVFNQVEGLTNNVIEFNNFTLISILDSFEVSFIVTDSAYATTIRKITFYPEYYVDSEDKSNAVMIWNKEDWSVIDQSSITFTNLNKSAENNSITTYEVYNFAPQQVGIDELDFGFGVGYAPYGEVQIIIDPLNPVIPTTALAKGKLNNDAQTEILLGEVDIDWEIDDPTDPNSIYYLNMSGASKLVYCDVSAKDKKDVVFKFAVNVTYLNRTPINISTVESGYTNVAREEGYYPLMSTIVKDNKNVKNYTFVVDPTPSDNRLFNVEGNTNVRYPLSTGGYARSNYTLPSTLRLTFANDYDIGSIQYEGIQKLGAEITLIDVDWIISRDITLTGTDVDGSNITAKIRKFRIQYVSEGKTYVSDLYDYTDDDAILGSYLTLNLKTINRQVEYTYVIKNGENAVLSEVPEGATVYYQQARDEFYIDPYNIYFPEDVYVVFAGSTIPYHALNVEWTYDEDHLKKHGVITGKDANQMVIMASMSVYGATVDVQFPIRARNIPASKELEDGQTTQDPLSAGTIYVLAGVPLEQQLPTHLYHRFDYEDGTSEIARVPLTFSPAVLATVKTDVIGRVYTNVFGKLGFVDDNNVFFTIKVIDPKLYALRSTVQNSVIGGSALAQAFINGGFVYDYIAIGVNAAGVYVPGPETNILPDRVIVSEDGEYMEILNIIYDVENLVATVECRYTFLSFGDSPRLSGDKDATSENSNKMFISFNVPIKTYSYNWLEEETASFEKTVYSFELGTVVTASDMPLTTSGIAPIWDLDNLNHNRAGEYKATYHYKNAYGKIITGEVTVVIERRAIKASDFTWIEDADGIDFLDRYYTPKKLNVEDYIQLGEFLREDGSYGPLKYSVLYSMDGRKNWSPEQPIDVKEFDDSPDYFVRIMISDADDYNYTGSVDYKMIIRKWVIDPSDIYFYNETDALGNHIPIQESEYTYENKDGAIIVTQMKQISYEYTGGERVPAVGGVPRGATTQATYAQYDPNATQQNYLKDLKPIEVGTYMMRVVFSGEQRNYTIGNVEFTMLIHVTTRNVNYTINNNYEYTGEYFNVTVNGLPENLSEGMEVVYSYKNVTTNETLPAGSRIRDAGQYDVTVKINGGRNYPNANLDGVIYPTLYEQRITVNKRKVILNVNEISAEYLDEVKPLNSALTIVWASNPSEPGLVGRYDTDVKTVFGNIDVAWTGGDLTYKHTIGDYPLAVVNKEAMLEEDFHKNYEFVEINDGVYRVVAEKENTRIIANKDELTQALQQLGDGDTAIWYFMAGSYGTISIDVNVSLSIVGAYDMASDNESIAVTFDQIIINKGAVLLDIVAFNDKANDSVVKLGKGASSLTVSRSSFVRKGSDILTNSTAIGTASGYTNTIYVSDSYFKGYTTAIYMLGGSLELSTSELYQNMNGVYLQKGNIILDTNKFIANRGSAVNIAYSSATTSIFDNTFNSNDIAIKTSVALRNDIRVQNVFAQNTITFEGWSEE